MGFNANGEVHFMVLGIGTDILKIDRIGGSCKESEDPFIKKVFSPQERKEAFNRDNKEVYYATRFAGKEAVFKSLSLNPNHINLSEIEILNEENGQPYVKLYGKIAEHAKERGIKEVLISLSYDTEYAIAYAIARGDASL